MVRKFAKGKLGQQKALRDRLLESIDGGDGPTPQDGQQPGSPTAGITVFGRNRRDDELQGTDGNDVLFGRRGEDALKGGAGDDYLSGNWGNDKLWGGTGADIFAFDGDFDVDRVMDFDGGSGDRLQVVLYRAHQRDWTAETVHDLAFQKNDNVMIDLGGKTNERIILRYSEMSELSAEMIDVVHNDRLVAAQGAPNGQVRTTIGTGGNDKLTGTAANDTIYGKAGNDRIRGGDGIDYLSGDRGRDKLWGGEGQDTFNFDGDFGFDRVMDFDAEAGDRLDFVFYAADRRKWDADTVLSKAVQKGANVVIDISPGSDERVVLRRTDLGDLAADAIEVLHYDFF